MQWGGEQPQPSGSLTSLLSGSQLNESEDGFLQHLLRHEPSGKLPYLISWMGMTLPLLCADNTGDQKTLVDWDPRNTAVFGVC